ncbi:MAG: hypothetical protein ACRC6A_04215, partial [Fusobacteriaceae bacterium]
DVIYSSSQFIPSSDVIKSNILLLSPTVDNATVSLPNISRFYTDPLPNGYIREGRTTRIFNRSTNKPITIALSSSAIDCKIRDRTNKVVTFINLPSNKYIELVPVFNETATESDKRFWAILIQ